LIASYRSTTMIITNSTDEEQCLSFYYYFSNSMREPNITFRGHPISTIQNSWNIVTVYPNDENKWYYSQTTFKSEADQYQVRQKTTISAY
jgi:hypothetical protein